MAHSGDAARLAARHTGGSEEQEPLMSTRTITPTRLPGLPAALSRGWEHTLEFARTRALRSVSATSLIFTVVTVAGLAAALQVLFGAAPDFAVHPLLA
jgi:hypothetical protein